MTTALLTVRRVRAAELCVYRQHAGAAVGEGIDWCISSRSSAAPIVTLGLPFLCPAHLQAREGWAMQEVRVGRVRSAFPKGRAGGSRSQEEVTQQGHGIGDLHGTVVIGVGRIQAFRFRRPEEEEVQDGDPVGEVEVAIRVGIAPLERLVRNPGPSRCQLSQSPPPW